MPQPELSPIQRLVLAFWALVAVLSRADVAAAVLRLREGQAPPPGAGPEPAPAPPPAPRPAATPAPAPAAEVKVRPPPAAPPAATAPPAAAPGPSVPGPSAPAPSAPAPAPSGAAAQAPRPPEPRGALLLLTLLQREGQLLDFIEEDLAGFPDAAIGAAARTVHAGCKRVIEDLFRPEPVYREDEGAEVTVAAGFDPAAIRLTGGAPGQPPFKGRLRHHGWRAREVKLPPAPEVRDPGILAPAEVEIR